MAKRRDENAPYWQQLRTAERGIIEYALEHGETIRGTAMILGVSPNFLSERMRELGIPVPDVRPGPKPGTKRPQRPQLRVVASADAPTETLDEDAPETPEEESEEGEGEKWYEDAEEDEDAEEGGDDEDGDEDDAGLDDDDGEGKDAKDQDDSEDASAQGN